MRIRTRYVLAMGVLVAVALSQCSCNPQRRDDKTITREIQAKLYHNAVLKTRDISIIAQDGVVTLSGQVSSEDEKASAEHLAATEPGVKQVINELAIVGSSPTATPSAQQAGAPKQSK